MNVLLITPIYHIEGRADLVHDSSAIHYLLSPLSSENRVVVYNTYCCSFKETLKRAIKRPSINEALEYDYIVDDIKVFLRGFHFLPRQFSLSTAHKRLFIEGLLTISHEFEPEVVVVHFPTTYKKVLDSVKSVFSKLPFVCVLHATDIARMKKHRELVAFINDNFNNVGFRSNSIFKLARDLGVHAQKRILYSGVKTTPYEYSSRDGEINRFLYVGKLIERKNVGVIIDAFRKFRNSRKHSSASLRIVGEGRMMSKLKKVAGEGVIFLGSLDRKEVLNEMQKADVFVMPSIHETLGLVYLEAMSQGCVTIGTRNEGIDGIIVDGVNGFLTDPDAKCLYDLFNRISEMDREMIKTISLNAIKTMSLLTELNASDNYYSFLRECRDKWCQ